MKTHRTLLPLLALFFVMQGRAQLTFTMATSLCEGNSATLTANTGTLSAIMYTWAALPSGPVFSSTNTSTTTVTFPAAGIYTIGTGILTMSGFAYATNTIQIFASPVLTTVASPTSICSGQSTTLTASGASSYTWSPSSFLSATSGSQVVANPPTPTTYTITGDNSGCTGTVSAVVLVYPQPSSFTISATSQSVCTGFTASLTVPSASGYTWTGTGITTPLNTPSIVVGAGSYSVSAQGANCAYSSSITISPQQPIIISTSASQATTCLASNKPVYSKSTTLTATGASYYYWIPYMPDMPSTGPVIQVRPASTTCYTVTGSTATCSNTAVVCVTVASQYTVELSTNSLPMCVGDSHTVSVVNFGGPSAGAPYTYQWGEPLNAPPISISSYSDQTVSLFPLSSCTYTAEVKDKDGCISKPALLAITVTTCTGIDENFAGMLQLYPNPAKTQLTIRSGLAGAYTLQMLDLQGKVVLQQELSAEANKEFSVNIGSVNPGVYLVRLNAPGKPAQMRKVIVEK